MSAGKLNISGHGAARQCRGDHTQTDRVLVMRDLHPNLAIQGITVGMPSLLVSATCTLIIEQNPKCGVNGAGCPPGCFSVLAFAAEPISDFW